MDTRVGSRLSFSLIHKDPLYVNYKINTTQIDGYASTIKSRAAEGFIDKLTTLVIKAKHGLNYLLRLYKCVHVWFHLINLD